MSETEHQILCNGGRSSKNSFATAWRCYGM
jgi:hypothetical protein